MATETTTLTLGDLADQASEEFRAWLEETRPSDPAEKISELTEDPGPSATTAILQLAIEDNWLAAAEPDSPPYETSAVFCIRQNVSEHIAGRLWYEWESWQD